VDGDAYLPEPVRQAEIDQALDDLLNAHHGWDNFYNEPRPAYRLERLVGRYGNVPVQLTRKYVEYVVYVFLTNGHGVAVTADPIYVSLINRFDVEQASIALRSFAWTRISSRLQLTLARTKWEELLDLLAPKLTGRRDRAFLDVVREFPGKPDQLVRDTEIKRQVDEWAAARTVVARK
jgi:hypothetical protein